MQETEQQKTTYSNEQTIHANRLPVVHVNLEVRNGKHLPTEAFAKQCNPCEYAKTFIYPTLLPALEAMLHKAKELKCFERRRFGFNGLDFLTVYLFCKNPWVEPGRELISKLEEIPWVATEWAIRPRAPLPLSLQWTDDEAATKIQSYWRGYTTRKDPEIQEMRQWQHEWRIYNRCKQATTASPDQT
ncbi:unnamed protein product [Dicrocoelium dendriticum]|nr:unnamed protein product [Dicrocoelium dendriticum]